MSTIGDHSKWMRLQPEESTRGRITAHSFGLALALILCWFYVMIIAARYHQLAYLSVEQQDFSGLGAARADFDLYLLVLPIMGFLGYWVIRAVIAAGEGLWMVVRR